MQKTITKPDTFIRYDYLRALAAGPEPSEAELQNLLTKALDSLEANRAQ